MASKRVCRKEMPKMEKLASRIFQSSRKVSESWRLVEHQTHKEKLLLRQQSLFERSTALGSRARLGCWVGTQP